MFIWGTGHIGHMAYEELRKNNIPIEGFIDSFYKERHITIAQSSVRVYGTDELQYINGDVLIAIFQYEEVVLKLVEYNNLNLIGIYVPDKGIVGYSESFQVVNNSQSGEELYLRELFSNVKNGFFVDVGALHPYRFSNTHWAYERGWKGINIEPNPEMFKLFLKYRERDINLNLGISNKAGMLNYYMYNEPAYNSFCKSDERKPKNTISVLTKSLRDIFREYDIRHIDFLSIDVEGSELSVLRSNDWDRWRPKWILVEQLEFDIDTYHQDELYNFLKRAGYKFDSKYNRTVFYQEVNDI